MIRGLAGCLAVSAITAGIVSADDAANQDPVILDEVQVIGDKVGRDLQELPTSTSVIDQTRIENEPIRNFDDILNRVANVQSEGLAQFGAFSIRGVNNNALIAGFNQSNLLATVSLNQVPLGGLTSDYLRPSTWDVSTVEVLRGPQSTLQGPNSMIGAIFFNYNRPDFTTEGRLRAEYGELNTWNVAAYQNLPLSDDVLAARITLETRNTDGGIKGVVTGEDDIARIDERMVRGQLLYRPLGTEDIQFNLTSMFNRSDTNHQAHVTELPPYKLEDRKNLETYPGEYPADVWFNSLEAQIRINEHWDLVSVTGYTDLDGKEGLYDGDLLPPDFLSVRVELAEEIFNQDLRLYYSGERIRGLLGFYYSSADLSGRYDSSGFIPLVGDYSAIFDLAEDVTTAAVYGNVDYDVLDSLTLNFGLRYNYENRENSDKIIFNGFPSDLGGEADFSKLLPTASVLYRVNDDVNVGFKYSRGYRSGGFSAAPFLQQTSAFDAEIADDYELFIRSQFLDGRLTINGNLFYMDWRDQQIPVLPPGGIAGFDELTVNAGKTELRGFELEASARINSRLNGYLSVGYVKSEFKEFEYNGIDYAGESLPNSPEWTLSIGADYTHPDGFFAGGNFRWVDKSYSDLTSIDGTQMSERNILDAKLGYRGSNWSVYLWGTNLLDDFYETYVYDASLFGFDRYAAVSTPRRLGLGAELEW